MTPKVIPTSIPKTQKRRLLSSTAIIKTSRKRRISPKSHPETLLPWEPWTSNCAGWSTPSTECLRIWKAMEQPTPKAAWTPSTRRKSLLSSAGSSRDSWILRYNRKSSDGKRFKSGRSSPKLFRTSSERWWRQRSLRSQQQTSSRMDLESAQRSRMKLNWSREVSTKKEVRWKILSSHYKMDQFELEMLRGLKSSKTEQRNLRVSRKIWQAVSNFWSDKQILFCWLIP